jgi:hypothetical protein
MIRSDDAVQIVYSGKIVVNNIINNVQTCMKGASIPVVKYDPSNDIITWTGMNNKGINNNYLPLPNNSTISSLMNKYNNNDKVSFTFVQFQISQSNVSKSK